MSKKASPTPANSPVPTLYGVPFEVQQETDPHADTTVSGTKQMIQQAFGRVLNDLFKQQSDAKHLPEPIEDFDTYMLSEFHFEDEHCEGDTTSETARAMVHAICKNLIQKLKAMGVVHIPPAAMLSALITYLVDMPLEHDRFKAATIAEFTAFIAKRLSEVSSESKSDAKGGGGDQANATPALCPCDVCKPLGQTLERECPLCMTYVQPDQIGSCMGTVRKGMIGRLFDRHIDLRVTREEKADGVTHKYNDTWCAKCLARPKRPGFQCIWCHEHVGNDHDQDTCPKNFERNAALAAEEKKNPEVASDKGKKRSRADSDAETANDASGSASGGDDDVKTVTLFKDFDVEVSENEPRFDADEAESALESVMETAIELRKDEDEKKEFSFDRLAAVMSDAWDDSTEYDSETVSEAVHPLCEKIEFFCKQHGLTSVPAAEHLLWICTEVIGMGIHIDGLKAVPLPGTESPVKKRRTAAQLADGPVDAIDIPPTKTDADGDIELASSQQ